MPDGGRAGKVTGTELAAELQAKKQKDAKQFAALDQQLTGHGAETVRDLLLCVLHFLPLVKFDTRAYCSIRSSLLAAALVSGIDNCLCLA